MTVGFRCVHCRQSNDQAAGEGCKNPNWHTSVPDVDPVQQPGACWRCKCDDQGADACGCCHMAPCEMER